jgi:hypothetical protein
MWCVDLFVRLPNILGRARNEKNQHQGFYRMGKMTMSLQQQKTSAEKLNDSTSLEIQSF